MVLNAIAEREINVGMDVHTAINLLKSTYGAKLTHDSGHNDVGGREASPTWIFTMGGHGNAQVAVRMNREKVSLYLSNRTPDGSELEPLLKGLAKIEKSYVNSGGGLASSLLNPNNAPYLCPSTRTPLLRLTPSEGKLPEILDLYLGASDSSPASISPDFSESLTEASSLPRRRVISAAELLIQLDRNAETGRAGEQIALIDELNRLHECGCCVPGKYVELKALSDVGTGYDIASNWPGEERCIEVKTTTAAGSDFFITENERQVLAELGLKAWLYRVVLQLDGSGEVVQRVQDPIRKIPDEAMRPAVWRVDAIGFDSQE